ncbi:hypothetical protein HDU77_005853 [Chytriomyces hyalinus]|nr:hypothetical protein HDU77_005853 [Chytriomyces hyalinus]
MAGLLALVTAASFILRFKSAHHVSNLQFGIPIIAPVTHFTLLRAKSHKLISAGIPIAIITACSIKAAQSVSLSSSSVIRVCGACVKGLGFFLVLRFAQASVHSRHQQQEHILKMVHLAILDVFGHWTEAAACRIGQHKITAIPWNSVAGSVCQLSKHEIP